MPLGPNARERLRFNLILHENIQEIRGMFFFAFLSVAIGAAGLAKGQWQASKYCNIIGMSKKHRAKNIEIM